MKKFAIGMGVLIILLGIGILYNGKKGFEEPEKKLLNSEVIVDSGQKQKAIAVGTIEKKKQKGEITLPNIEASIVKKENGQTFGMKFELKNKGNSVRSLQYTTSQRYDYEIYTKDGELINRYSDGKSFLQVLKEIPLEPNESVSFDIVLPKLETGSYKIVVWPTAKGTSALRLSEKFKVQ